mmetsp:Transcript_33584/g.81200  ORF Transcript_33584/g.81200 Transcript_33584/m.81200 type:complete len:262 (+) Transcript_33584:138-923(+)
MSADAESPDETKPIVDKGFAEPGYMGYESKGRSKDGSIHKTDEVFNTGSHFVGTMLAILGTVALIVESAVQLNPWKIVGFSIYGASLIFLFASSTLHHGVHGSEGVNLALKTMDYVAIFPLIAGTYTPLVLVFLNQVAVAWAFLIVVWSLALLGMVVKGIGQDSVPKWFTLTIYVTLGWFAIFLFPYVMPYLGFGGCALMILGGLLYTVGGVIFQTEWPNPIPGQLGFHEIWHVLVLAAAMAHWAMMWYFVLPYEKGTATR